MASSTVAHCPGCGYDNNPYYRFCGMCGTPLHSGTEPLPPPPPAPSPLQSAAPAPPVAAPRKDPPLAVGGYSILGLSEDPEPLNSDTDTGRGLGEERLPMPDFGPYTSRRRADYLLEEDDLPASSWRMYLALALLALAAGAFAWQLHRNGYSWETFSKFANSAERPASAATNVPAEPAASLPASAQTTSIPQPVAALRQTTATAVAQPAPDAETLPATPAPTKVIDTTQIPVPKVLQTSTAMPRSLAQRGRSAASESSNLGPGSPAVEKARPPESDPNQLFADGSKYLYGDGVAQDCNRAQKDLRASARSNPEAQSLLGTMYASGHCVGRDLPTAYRWYARALRGEPSNNRLQSDLEVIWNQMTTAEKQAAQRPLQ